jgi:hypothetical protein
MINLLKTHKDKVLHFLGCFFLTSIWLPLGVAFAIGKEVWDIRKRGFDKDNILDLLADGLGIGLAIIIGAF